LTAVFKGRIAGLRASLEREGLEAYVVSEETNVLYFTGFPYGGRLIIPREADSCLYVHRVNYELARRTVEDLEVDLVGWGAKADQRVAEEIRRLGLRGRVGFDALDVSVYSRFSKSLRSVKLEPFRRLVKALRTIKDETELKYLRKAAELTSEGLKAAFDVIKPGVREFEAAAEVEYAMRRRGSEGVAFDTIVASGFRSGFPHSECTDKKVSKGDLVVVDLGARFHHYRGDATRTVVVGKPSAKQLRIFEIVREAQDRAFKCLKAGVRACDVDATAREFIAEEGYGEFFVHSLGHGVGLEVHEPPSLNPDNEEQLRMGNVVTVEPGIYLPDLGGVRIEDTVLVVKGGAEKLTEAPYMFEV
jgi:Xaa-Pro aminopeptidase